MSKNNILLIDPAFDPSLSQKLRLIVKIGTDTLTYAIIDDEQKLLYAVFNEQECLDVHASFAKRVKNDAYLNIDFGEVLVAAHSQNQFFVPNQLLSDELIKTQTAFFTPEKTGDVYVKALDKFSSVFAFPKAVETAIETNWAAGDRTTENEGLIKIATAAPQKQVLLIDFTVKSFEVVFCKNQEFQFQQSYTYDNVDELTYYILLMVKQLNVDTKDVAVLVSGIIDIADEKWNRLAQYFTNVSCATPNANLNMAILEDMPLHYYTSLLSLYPCE